MIRIACAVVSAISLAAPLPASGAHPLAALCLPAGVVDRPICLENGTWEGEPSVAGGASRPGVQLLENLSAIADLDGDGEPERIGMVSESSGGSGSRLYLVVVRPDGERPRAIATALVGDRIQIRDLVADGGTVRLSLVRQGENEPMCCPTRKAELEFSLLDGELALTAERAGGTISLADLEGATWRLSRLARDEPAPESPAVTLVVTAGKVSGSSGCNRYMASVLEPSPRMLELGPIAGTRRLCGELENAVETQVLAGLAATNAYSFLGGELALTGTLPDGAPSMLVFRRQR